MKFIQLLAVLASMVFFASACDNTCSDCHPSLDLYDHFDCPPYGTILYRLSGGVYKTQSVPSLSEDCGLGLTPELLIGDRQVQYNTSIGTITVLSADGSVTLGTGAVRCNKGTLTYNAPLQTETCSFDSARSSQFELTADNTFTLKYTETRTQFQSVLGMTCTKPASGSCMIAYTLNMKQ